MPSSTSPASLLRRYGVVCWRLLEREAAWLPPWRDLVRVYRRLEARGEIRGGRFIAGLSGEQFALPEAIGLMREVRRRPPDGAAGLRGRRRSGQPARQPCCRARRCRGSPGARVLYRDGVPVASWVGGQVEWLEPTSVEAQRAAVRLLSLDPGLRLAERAAAAARAPA